MSDLSDRAIEALKEYEHRRIMPLQGWPIREYQKELLDKGLIEVIDNLIFPTKTGYSYLTLLGVL